MKKFASALLCLLIGSWLGFMIMTWLYGPKEPSQQKVEIKKTTPKASQNLPAKAPSAPEKILATAPSKPKVEPKVRARVAIVLDDWGYNMKAMKALEELNIPVTLAILPHLPYTKRIANEAYARGHEIILHMPMEPKRDVPLEKNTLKVDMGSQEMEKILTAGLEAIPYVRGVSNHMGSKMTSDKRSMQILLDTIHRYGYYFLDSMSSGTHTASQIAKNIALPHFERDVFLDNNREKNAILAQLGELKEKALRKGYSIGIGHDEVVTLEAIKAIEEDWKSEGIDFVVLSDLLEFTTKNPQHLTSSMLIE